MQTSCTAVDKNQPIMTAQERNSKYRGRNKKMRRDPKAPRRFKSAFILYAADKQREVREHLREQGVLKPKSTLVSKVISKSWKSLPDEVRALWYERSTKDKERYQRESAAYKGPWKVPAEPIKKDPNAPKRPVTAYFFFSNSRRASISKSMTDASNGQVSRELSKIWKSMSYEMKRPYLEQQQKDIQRYQEDLKRWKEANRRTTNVPPQPERQTCDIVNGDRHHAVDKDHKHERFLKDSLGSLLQEWLKQPEGITFAMQHLQDGFENTSCDRTSILQVTSSAHFGPSDVSASCGRQSKFQMRQSEVRGAGIDDDRVREMVNLWSRNEQDLIGPHEPDGFASQGSLCL